MTYHVNTTTKSMYQCEKCALRTHSHETKSVWFTKIISQKIPKYIFARVYTIILSCRRFVPCTPILYYCIFMKFVNTQNDLKLCSCRNIFSYTCVYMCKPMKDFPSFLFFLSYSIQTA